MTRLIVALGFLIAFAAGWAVGVGMETRRATATTLPSTRPSRGPGSFLTAELNLTPQQQEQLKQIWSEAARHGGHDQDDIRHKLRTERDEAIKALVRAEDKDKYEQVVKAYSDQIAAIDREWRASYEQSVEKTNEILTPEQRKKYADIRGRHQPDRGSRGMGRPGPGGPTREIDRPASRPATGI